MSIKQPNKRKSVNDRYSEMQGIKGTHIPKQKQPRDRIIKGAAPEEIIQNHANDYLRRRKISFTHYSARVLSRGDDSISGDPDNMIRMPIKGTPFCLMLNIEFKKRGKDRRLNQEEKAPSFNSSLVTKFEEFEKLMLKMDDLHQWICEKLKNR